MSAGAPVLAAARGYIAYGWAIVPVRGKVPVDKEWRRKFSEDEIITRLKGECTGFGFLGGDLNHHILALDFDSDAGEAWWRSRCEAAGIDPDDFPTVITPGKPKDGKRTSGRHRYVTDVRRTLGNAEGDLRRLGINVRGRGHAVLPPSPHPDGGTYRWVDRHSLDDFEIIPACPSFIYDAIDAGTEPQKANGKASNFTPDDGARRYCRAALDNEIIALARTASERNIALNNAALKLGSLHHHGAFTEAEVQAALRGACEQNGLIGDDGVRAFEATFQSGWKAGLEKPRPIEARLETRRANGAGAAGDASACLAIADWIVRDIPPPDFLLGELMSTTTRALLSAPTGLGKTNFSMAMGIAMAAGQDFLHWKTIRAAKVLLIDGEMSRRLLKIRLADAVRRLGAVPKTFFALCRDDVENMPPLNTPEGQAYIDAVIGSLGGIDFLIPDNVMSLTSGDMKDEETWANTLPWIRSLTKRSIGQLWIHHTGLDQTRSYGTSTREWQLDTSMLMEAIERPGADIAFNLKFTKARERAPHNRVDFEPVIITLTTDQWGAETDKGDCLAKPRKKPSPVGQSFHQALVNAVATLGQPRAEAAGQPSVTMDEWEDECARRGLIDRTAPDNRKRALISKYRRELVSCRDIACNEKVVWNRTVAR